MDKLGLQKEVVGLITSDVQFEDYIFFTYFSGYLK